MRDVIEFFESLGYRFHWDPEQEKVLIQRPFDLNAPEGMGTTELLGEALLRFNRSKPANRNITSVIRGRHLAELREKLKAMQFCVMESPGEEPIQPSWVEDFQIKEGQ